MTNLKGKAFLLAFQATTDILVVDLMTKAFFFNDQDLMAKPTILGFFQFTNHRNTGITFDLPLPLPVVLIVTAVIVGYILRTLFMKRANLPILEALAYGLILGGAIGNLIDRIWLGYVRDWMLLFGRSAMNLADFSIIIGLLLLLLALRVKPSTPDAGQTV